MAKFQPTLGNLSGSIGATTFSRNKGGAYAKLRSNPTNPTTTRQQVVRGILATLSSAWSLLSDANREAWRTWAALNPQLDSLGNTIQLSGQQAFVALNARLLDAGGAQSDTPPATTGPAALDSLTVTWTAPTTISAAYTATPLAAGCRLILWMTKPTSGARDPGFAQATLVGYTAAAAASPATPTAVFSSSADQRANFYAQVMDASGQVSPPLKSAAVAA